MARSQWLAVSVVLFLGAGVAEAQPESPLILKWDDKLPAGARARLGKLAGSYYAESVTHATLSPDGKLLAVVDSKDTISVTEVATGKVVQRIQGAFFFSAVMAFSADNSALVVQAAGELMVLDVASGKSLLKVKNTFLDPGDLGPSLSPGGKYVRARIMSLENKSIVETTKVFEIASGKAVASLESMQAAFAPDGKTMIAWNVGRLGGRLPVRTSQIQVWDLVNAREIETLNVEAQFSIAVCLADGKSIAALGTDYKLHLIDRATGKVTRSLAGDGGIGFNVAMHLSPDGRFLVARDRLRPLRAWDLSIGKRISLANAPSCEILSVAFPVKESIRALGLMGKTLIWWDIAGPEASTFEGQLGPITSLAFTADGQTLVSSSTGRRVLFWNTVSGEIQREFNAPLGERLNLPDSPVTIAITPDGKRVAAYSAFEPYRQVQFRNLEDGKTIRELDLPDGSRDVSGLQFWANGKILTALGREVPLTVWNTYSGKEIYAAPTNDDPLSRINNDLCCAVSRNGKILATMQLARARSSRPSGVVLRDLTTDEVLHRIELPVQRFSYSALPGMAFSPDSKLLAFPDEQRNIHLANVATGRVWRKLSSASRTGVALVAFSSDGRFVASGSNSGKRGYAPSSRPDDNTIEVWEVASGHKREQFKGHIAGVSCLTFSPDGSTLATGSLDTTVLLWDLAGKNVKAMPFADEAIADAWKSLTADDAKVAMTIRRLIRAPATVAYLKQHLLPVKKIEIDNAHVARLIGAVESGTLKERESATRDLRALGARVESALKERLKADLEARRRIQGLLDAIADHQPTPAEIQALRGVEILERVGTPAARDVLTALSQGDPFASLTREATAALDRLHEARH